MYEENLLNEAVDAINKETGLDVKILLQEYAPRRDDGWDAVIRLPDHGIQLNAQIKTWTGQMNVGAVANRLKQQGRLDDALLVADYINPTLAKRLIETQIQFIDTAGNAYINKRPFYVRITGNRKPRPLIGHPQKTGRAFQQTGMKVIFAILKDQNLLNAPYRLIAEKAQVALGNIGWILNDLTYQGYVQEGFRKNTRTIADYNTLFHKWVEEYPTKLRAKLRLGKFTTENPFWWEALEPGNLDAFWGGELAAKQYTNYLNPKDFIVYLDKKGLTNFLAAARLKKFDPARTNGIQVDIYQQFWTEDPHAEWTFRHLTHPIITYADLVETRDPRNLEAAERLRGNHIH
jgi:hypothetical protein